MDRRTATVGSAVFFLAAPGTVAGLVPWALTGWVLPDDRSWAFLARAVVAGAAILAGLAMLLAAFTRFVREGSGTPAPVAPTERLVIGGVYRYVRNPMYVAVVAILLGQTLLFAAPGLALYAGVAWATMAAFVRWYEEPRLAEVYGPAYEDYRRHVRAWLPRLRPWAPRPPAGAGQDSAV